MLPFRTFVVADTSMQPAFSPGDRVLVMRMGKAKAGDVVVFRDPQARSQFLVKRVVACTKDGYVVRGDNPNVSRDSRDFGPIAHQLIVGKVVYRYLPAERRGRTS